VAAGLGLEGVSEDFVGPESRRPAYRFPATNIAIFTAHQMGVRAGWGPIRITSVRRTAAGELHDTKGVVGSATGPAAFPEPHPASIRWVSIMALRGRPDRREDSRHSG